MGCVDFFDISSERLSHVAHKACPRWAACRKASCCRIPALRGKEIVGDRAKVFVVGRIKQLAMAEEAVASGAADMVAMLRAQIADPFLVRKTLEGRSAEVRALRWGERVHRGCDKQSRTHVHGEPRRRARGDTGGTGR